MGCDKCGRGKEEFHHETRPTRFKECEPVIHPTRHRVVEQTEVIIIPEVHPTHTTFVNNRVLRHVHHYPESDSVEENTINENVVENDQRENRNGFERRRRGGWSWI
ncbi:spore coat protein [Bacillus sp. JCM 19041]|uniref:spore coat protein n=1 Tax=Bacillus sp. JCM 19041 TaxID=1460637 RepID=UPI0006D10B29